MSMDTPDLPEKPAKRNQYAPAVTKAKQERYLEARQRTGSHRDACAYADCDASMPFYWASKNLLFSKRLDQVTQQGDKVLLSRYESTLDQAVLGSDTIDNVAKTQVLRMFRMKKLDPSYRENAQVQVHAVGPIAIQFNIAVPASPTTDHDDEKA